MTTRWKNGRWNLISSPAANCSEVTSPSGNTSPPNHPVFKTLPFCSFPGCTGFNDAQQRLALWQCQRQRGSETEVEGRMKGWAGYRGEASLRITDRVRREGASPGRKEGEAREVKRREKRDGNKPDKESENRSWEESAFIIISLFPDKPAIFLMTPMRVWIRARIMSTAGKQRCTTPPSSG